MFSKADSKRVGRAQSELASRHPPLPAPPYPSRSAPASGRTCLPQSTMSPWVQPGCVVHLPPRMPFLLCSKPMRILPNLVFRGGPLRLTRDRNFHALLSPSSHLLAYTLAKGNYHPVLGAMLFPCSSYTAVGVFRSGTLSGSLSPLAPSRKRYFCYIST